MTNLNKTREEIIYELVLSLNKGDSYYAAQRIDLAIEQYNALVKNKIVTELCEHDWQPMEQICPSVCDFKCAKCGAIETRQYPF